MSKRKPSMDVNTRASKKQHMDINTQASKKEMKIECLVMHGSSGSKAKRKAWYGECFICPACLGKFPTHKYKWSHFLDHVKSKHPEIKKPKRRDCLRDVENGRVIDAASYDDVYGRMRSRRKQLPSTANY